MVSLKKQNKLWVPHPRLQSRLVYVWVEPKNVIIARGKKKDIPTEGRTILQTWPQPSTPPPNPHWRVRFHRLGLRKLSYSKHWNSSTSKLCNPPWRVGEGLVVLCHGLQHQGGRLQPRVGLQFPQDQPLGHEEYMNWIDWVRENRLVLSIVTHPEGSGEGLVVHGHGLQHQGGRLQPRVGLQLPENQPLVHEEHFSLFRENLEFTSRK